MSKTAVPTSGIQTSLPAGGPVVRERRPETAWSAVKKTLAPVASLRLTVVLFALSLGLVFFGTLAQMDQGIWTVLHKYFRTWLAWIPFQLFVRFGQVFFGVSPDAQVSGSFPFPGGWLLGGLLLMNLLAAHLVRFKLGWKRSGILVLHAGVVVMMVNEFATGAFSVEERMTINEGQTAHYAENLHAAELAVIDPSDTKSDQVVVVPASIVQKGGLIQHD